VAGAAHATLLRVEQEAEEVQRTSTKLKLEARDALNMVREAVTKAAAPQVGVKAMKLSAGTWGPRSMAGALCLLLRIASSVA
jgi:hypothetical protein